MDRCERIFLTEEWPYVKRCENKATERLHIPGPRSEFIEVCKTCADDYEWELNK